MAGLQYKYVHHDGMLRHLILSLLMLQGGGVVVVSRNSSTITAAAAAAEGSLLPQALRGCRDHCGSLTIPYPFGMDEGCYRGDRSKINCTESTHSTSLTAYLMGALGANAMIVTDISLDGELQIRQHIARNCYDKRDKETYKKTVFVAASSPFTLSSTKNKLVGVGCEISALFEGDLPNGSPAQTWCDSSCANILDQDSCSGTGCCQASIPSGLKKFGVILTHINTTPDKGDLDPCSYTFIVGDGEFELSKKSFQKLIEKHKCTSNGSQLGSWGL